MRRTTSAAPTTNVAPGAFTFVVTSTADAGPGTLRQAITDSNLNVGSTNQIHFNVTGEAPFVIAPQSALPNINVPVIIDGYTPARSVAEHAGGRHQRRDPDRAARQRHRAAEPAG